MPKHDSSTPVRSGLIISDGSRCGSKPTKDKNRQRKAYVYCVTDGEYYKIGCAVNVTRRIAGLQTSNPRELILVGVLECNGRQQALARERNLHKQHRKHRVRGEWFTDAVARNPFGKY